MNKGLFSSNTNEWATPAAFFAELDAEFHFDLDPCATPGNAKCADFYTIETDGLTQNWGGAACVLQPTIRTRDRALGAEMLRRKQPRRAGRAAHTGPDGHGILPRLHLPQGAGGALHPRPSAFQRSRPGSVPVYGRNFLTL